MKTSEKSVLLCSIAIGIFSLGILLTPLLLPSSSISNLSGQTIILDTSDAYDLLPLPITLFYLSGDILCHQQADRSFYLNGNQMPFCSRCTSIFIGLSLGMLLTLFLKIDANRRLLILLICSLLPLMIDGGGQYLGWWTSTQTSRVLTGLICGCGLGAAIGALLLMPINHIKEFSLKKE